MKKAILVTGGAGYIGSHIAYLLSQSGYLPIIIDSFNNNQVFNPLWAYVVKKKCTTEVFDEVFTTFPITAIVHCAASIEIPFSVQHPREFYANNLTMSVELINAAIKYKVPHFIFSSSCAVYGEPQYTPIDELHPLNPINAYGNSKLAIERLLADYVHAYEFSYTSLRYFNASGAYPEKLLGEQHIPETHLIPRVLKSLAENRPITIFGTNYNTPDGTCIRDYIHVLDIARAHTDSLTYLLAGGKSDVFNLGTGTGYSTKQVVETAARILQTEPKIVYAPRRAGDAQTLIADPRKAETVLQWRPQQSDLESIITSAQKWELIKLNWEGAHEKEFNSAGSLCSI